MSEAMNLIQQEQHASKKYTFKTYPGTDLAVLSRRNVALAEAMIANNSSYRPKKRGGSSAETGDMDSALTKLCQVLLGKLEVSRSKYACIVGDAVKEVDAAYSTHLNADHVGREVMRDRIVGFGRDGLVECLLHPNVNDPVLFRTLEARTTETKGGRMNPSFASKFCHEMCQKLFEGEPEQDNYPVYDNVVSNGLRRYVKHFDLSNVSMPKRRWNQPFDYPSYCECVNAVIGRACDPISRTGFDHLVWYYFKGRA